jgi:hypothetical protein
MAACIVTLIFCLAILGALYGKRIHLRLWHRAYNRGFADARKDAMAGTVRNSLAPLGYERAYMLGYRHSLGVA